MHLATSPSGASSVLVPGSMAAATPRKLSKKFRFGPDSPLEGRSLYVFGPDNAVRKAVARVIVHRWFERAILFLVLASSVALALDSPVLDPNGPMKRALTIMDYVFVAAFTVEAIMKAVAQGFAFNGRLSYLRSSWNVLDFIIVLLGLITVALEAGGVSASSQLAALR